MSKQTLVLIIILFLFTVGLLGLALNKSSYSPKTSLPLSLISPAPIINPYLPDTSLLFGNLQVILASESAAVTLGSQAAAKTTKEYLLPIIINTGANKVTTVQLELAFDPGILTKVNITPSSFFDNSTIFINNIDSKNGRVSYALGLNPSASESAESLTVRGKQGEGTLASLTFQTRGSFQLKTSSNATNSSEVATTQGLRQTNITFLPKTFVIAEDIEQSALKSTNSAQLTY